MGGRQGSRWRRRVHPRVRARNGESDHGATPRTAGEDRTARFLAGAALAVGLALTLLLATHPTLRAPSPPPPSQEANDEQLAAAFDLGAGLTELLIEHYHSRHTWRTRITVDSTRTLDEVQGYADALALSLSVTDLVEHRGALANVPSGDTLPDPVRRALERRGDPRLLAAARAGADLTWLLFEGAVAENYSYPEYAQQMRQAFRTGAHDAVQRLERDLPLLGGGEVPEEQTLLRSDLRAEACARLMDELRGRWTEHEDTPHES